MDPKGALVVVTGAGSGIGRALTLALAAAGARHVIAADLDLTRAEETAALAGAGRASGHRLDVRDPAAVTALVATTEQEQGPIDLYCSNAGVLTPGGLEVSDADWKRHWEVHVLAHLHAARALVPNWLARGRGYFLATVSAAGLLNEIDSLPYGVTKSAGLSLVEWLSITYGDAGVVCSALCPQGVRTAMLPADNFLAEGALSPEEVAAATLRGLAEERFLILPHPEVAEYFRRRATDHDRWLRGMRRLHARVTAEEAPTT